MEHQVSEWLINSWAFILTLILTIYVALDGFDLGIVILSLLEKDKSRQVLMMESLRRRDDNKPFIWCLVSLVIAVIGLVASHYPFLIPGSMTLHAATSSTKTLEFMLMAIGVLLPLMLGYNAYQYYVFRGRTSSGHSAGH